MWSSLWKTRLVKEKLEAVVEVVVITLFLHTKVSRDTVSESPCFILIYGA